MINLHVGIPHLLPNLIHDIQKRAIVNSRKTATVISRDEWKSLFRPALSERRRKILEIASMPALQGAYTGSDSRNITISQHTFLGKGISFFAPKHSIIGYERKIEKLVGLFEGRRINIHILIKDQHEYLRGLTGEELNHFLQSDWVSIPSWSDLVQRIRISAPNSKLIVWDCEEENKIAFAFATWMLELKRDAEMNNVYNFVREYMQKISATRGQMELNLPPRVSESLDLQYFLDCEEISKMEGVSFVKKERVPKALQVSI